METNMDYETIIDQLAAQQAVDREEDQDYETASLVRSERDRAGPVKINALTPDEYQSRIRPQRNLMSRQDSVIHIEAAEPYDRGADKYDPGTKPAQAYRPSVRVSNDLVAEGHGFAVEQYSNPDLLGYCRYCGDRLLPPDETSPREFVRPAHPAPLTAPVPPPTKYGVPLWLREADGSLRRPECGAPIPIEAEAPGFVPDRCRCNGCVVRREGRRKRGGQPIRCGKTECGKAMRSEQNARKRERDRERDRLYAVEVIRFDPLRPDKEIATALGIPKIRVVEARDVVSS